MFNNMMLSSNVPFLQVLFICHYEKYIYHYIYHISVILKMFLSFLNSYRSIKFWNILLKISWENIFCFEIESRILEARFFPINENLVFQ